MTPDGLSGDRPPCHDDAAYVLGALSPADRRAYEEHLRDCAVCQASVRSLAGLPGLLALTSEDAVTDARPPVPPSLRAGLLRRVQRARRRRTWLAGGLAAAAAVVLLVVVWALARPDAAPTAGADTGTAATATAPTVPATVPTTTVPTTVSPPVPPDETVPLAQVLPGPMTATLELGDRRWGTAITVVCSYDASMRNSVAYDLAIVDADGHETSAGSWSGVPGATARIPVATAVPRNQISAFEVRLTDGRTILRGAP